MLATVGLVGTMVPEGRCQQGVGQSGLGPCSVTGI